MDELEDGVKNQKVEKFKKDLEKVKNYHHVFQIPLTMLQQRVNLKKF